MSKLCILALLFYNITVINCVPLIDDINIYKDQEEAAKYNLLEFFKVLDEKTRENRREAPDSSLEAWTGRWMPEKFEATTPTPKPTTKPTPVRSGHVPMGSTQFCDTGRTNLTVDWDNSPVNYTCYGPRIRPSFDIDPLLYTEQIPFAYTAEHRCMDANIEYQEVIPLYGTHRPAWPTYGEYKFIPRQRWLHSLEHGAVVMLYHPCANPLEIQRLKSLVTDCLRRHIISPYNLVDQERPLVLVTWGARLSMSYVNNEIVKTFIRQKALLGPEPIARHGTFSEGLLSEAKVVHDFRDTKLCPNM